MTYKEWDRLTSDLRSGKEPMTREGMLAAIEDMAPGGGPGSSIDAWVQNQRDWLAAAEENWIDVLLAVVADPPPEDEQGYSWDLTAHCFLSEMIEKFPSEGFAKVTVLLPTENAALRPYLICGLKFTHLPEARAWLQPFVDSIESLPIEEMEQLTDVGEPYSNAERHEILLRIRDAIPPIRDEAHDELRQWVEDCLGYTGERLDEMAEAKPPAST